MTKTRVTRQTLPDKQQVAAFRKAARQLGADESKERFQDVLRKISKTKPTKGQKK